MKSLLPLIAAFVMPDDFDMETTTKNYGLDKLGLMIEVLQVIESEIEEVEKNLNDLKTWLKEKINRELSSGEEMNLLQGLYDYMRSDPATKERSAAMEYLFNAEFLTPPERAGEKINF